MNTPKTASLHQISSRRDINGNCYHAATYTDHATGRSCSFTVDAASNARFAMHRSGMGHDFGAVILTEEQLPIRRFHSLVKPWPYAGCTAAEIAAHINKALAGQEVEP
jgi:hypothetical protein